jgi:hypothetical protein
MKARVVSESMQRGPFCLLPVLRTGNEGRFGKQADMRLAVNPGNSPRFCLRGKAMPCPTTPDRIPCPPSGYLGLPVELSQSVICAVRAYSFISARLMGARGSLPAPAAQSRTSRHSDRIRQVR